MNNKDNTTTNNQDAAQIPAQSRQPRNQSASRRKALKTALAGGAVVTAGSASTKWVAPVVDSVVLPAHAQTSTPGTPAACGAPEGCYIIPISGGDDISMFWSGGAGPSDTPFYDSLECGDEEPPELTDSVVVAANEAEAAEALGGCPVNEILTDPAPPEGCGFFICD